MCCGYNICALVRQAVTSLPVLLCMQVSTGPGTTQEPHPWRQAIYLLAQPRRVRTGAAQAPELGPCPVLPPVGHEDVESVNFCMARDLQAGPGAHEPASELALHVDFNKDACGEVHLALDWKV